MGDIVKSSSKRSGDLMDHFKKTIEIINKRHKKNIASPLTITLGDEFQGVVKDLKSAIDILFDIDQLILESDIYYNMRFVINYGEIDTPINKKNAYQMLGKGLTEARAILNGQKKNEIKVVIEGIEESKSKMINSAFILYQSLYNDIKKKDRKLAHEFLLGGDYKTLANKFGKNDSSIWRKRRSLKIDAYQTSNKLIKMIADE